MQDKICAIKITETREERIANSFYPGSATSRATSNSQATYLRFSTIFVNSSQPLNTPWDPLSLCSRFAQAKRQTTSRLQLCL